MKKHGNVTGEFHIGVTHPNPVYCRSCRFAHGPAPWADTPEKGNCLMYPRESGELKPDSVAFDGKPCKYYLKDEK